MKEGKRLEQREGSSPRFVLTRAKDPVFISSVLHHLGCRRVEWEPHKARAAPGGKGKPREQEAALEAPSQEEHLLRMCPRGLPLKATSSTALPSSPPPNKH